MPLQRHLIVDLIYAAKEGIVEDVRRFLAASEPGYDHMQALLKAAEHGHSDIVKILMDVSKFKNSSFSPLSAAAKHQHMDCVRVLAPVANQEDRDYALYLALIKQNTPMAELLFDQCDLHAVLKRFKQTYGNDAENIAAFVDLQQRITFKEEQATLIEATNSSAYSSVPSTKNRM